MGKALNGINILEFDSNLGAAYAAMLLAEKGARAIKVEPPGGRVERGTPHFQVLNRSKRTLELDLDDRASQARVAALIQRADIVVTGFTPAQAEVAGTRLRIDSPHKSARDRAQRAAVRQPRSRRRVRRQRRPGRRARRHHRQSVGAQRQSGPAGVSGRELFGGRDGGDSGGRGASRARANGAGQAVEVSLLAGAFSLHTGGILRHEKMTTLYHGPQDPLGPIPCYRLFEASDHKYLFAACGNATFWGKFVLALDLPELVSDPRFENAPWGIPAEHWQALKDILEPVIRTRPRDEWVKILREADVPCAPVMTRQEFIAYPQTRALGMRQEIDDPILGRMVQIGVPVFLNATPGEISGPAPEKGDEHAALQASRANAPLLATNEICASLKGPLDGVTVLDFASYIAGSYGPMILAQLGANVIKIENLDGDAFRHFGFGFLGWNQGKRGLAIDLTSARASTSFIASRTRPTCWWKISGPAG